MAEYIEREAALIICEKEYQERVKMRDWCGDTVAWNIGHAIKAIQTADVVPVVHGRLEHLEQGWIDLWRCSACGDEWTFEYDPTDSEIKVNYCPNCGARMDGE